MVKFQKVIVILRVKEKKMKRIYVPIIITFVFIIVFFILFISIIAVISFNNALPMNFDQMRNGETEVFGLSENEKDYLVIKSYKNIGSETGLSDSNKKIILYSLFGLSKLNEKKPDYFEAFSSTLCYVFLNQKVNELSFHVTQSALLEANSFSDRLKLQGISLATEKKYSQEELFSLFLNAAYFGNDVIGMTDAAKTYLNKDIKELTAADIVTLVVIYQNPNNSDIYSNVINFKKHYNGLLEKLKARKIITDDQFVQNIDMPKIVHNAVLGNSEYDCFSDYCINEAVNQLSIQKGYSKTYSKFLLLAGHYKIYSTLRMSVQKGIDTYYEQNRKKLSDLNSEMQAATVITGVNGDIVGLRGNIGTTNAAVDYATAQKRWLGSTMKPIGVYAPAMENNSITWSTMFQDSPVNSMMNSDGSKNDWPKNYSNSYSEKNVTVDDALQQSLNTVAVRTLQKLTPLKACEFLNSNLGMDISFEKGLIQKDDIKMNNDILSALALGYIKKGLSPLELAGAYQMFSNGGLYTKPYSFLKITSENGETFLKNEIKTKRVLSEETATVMNKLLQDVITGENGLAKQAKLNNMPAAGKTGTTIGNKDRWFAGLTPYYVMVQWCGLDANSNLVLDFDKNPCIPFFKGIMDNIHSQSPFKDFLYSDKVIQKAYCVYSGDIANANCKKTKVGFYKKDALPNICNIH